jgi:hypothetical protein
MTRRDVAAACAAAGLLLAGVAGAADEPEGGSKPVAIYVELSPADLPAGAVQHPGTTLIVEPGTPVRIGGVTTRELAGQPLLVVVTPPEAEWDIDPSEGEPRCPGDEEPGTRVVGTYVEAPTARIPATVGPSGRFEAEFTPEIDGEHEVVVGDAAGRYRGEATFIAGSPEIEEDCKEIPQEQVEETVAELTQAVCDATEALNERARELPPSPAREELEKRLREVEDEVKAASPCGEAPQWVNATWHVNALRKVAPQMRAATRPVVQEIDRWLVSARKARDEAPKALAEIRQGNVVCDQLDIIVNGLKFVDFYLGLIIEPAKFLGDWAKENVPTKLVGLIPAISRTPAVKDGVELAWKGVTSYQPKREAGKIKISAQGFDRTLAAGKMVNGVAAYAASRIFEQLCQTFQGAVTGSMSAEFVTGSRVWWQYTIEIAGQLTLRYPSDAKGESIPLTGEFLGNATHIKSWDNAVPELFPELAQGTVFRTLRIEPIVMDTLPFLYAKNLGAKVDPAVPDFNPVKSTIDQGGAITQLVMTPAFFRVPVRAELRGKTLRLELQPAAVDFDDLRVKVVQIMLPVLSLWPEVIDYALPYKGAHFIMLRAMNDGPVEFAVAYEGQAMKIARTFNRERKTPDTAAVYMLKVDACNPGC